jgi:PAS domain S-box-containing protein
MATDGSWAAEQEEDTASGGELGEALRASEQLFTRQFGSMPWSMIAISLNDGQPSCYLTVNDAYCQLTGYSRPELTGRELLGDIHPEDQPGLDDLIQQLIAGQTDQIRADTRLIAKDGQILFTRLTGSAIASSPPRQQRYLATFVQDVTAGEQAKAGVRQLEAELARSRRLESLGQLVGGFAHDFNNLLTVIANYASLVCDEVSVAEATESKSRWEPVRWDTEQIVEATDRAKRLIEHLLAFARRDVAQPVLVDLAQLISDVSVLLGEALSEDTPVDVQVGQGTWPVEVDRGLLEQAIINIAVNARDAMLAGGKITIAASNVDTAGRDGADIAPGPPDQDGLADLLPGRYVRLRVTDTGTGMDAVIAERAFEPFFSTKSSDQAAGLGLSVVRRFAVQAGGKAWLCSEPGNGTTVTLMLPAAPGSAAAGPRAAPGERAASAGTVLVVDDEPSIAAVAHRVLTSAGYHVMTAANGQEALGLLQDGETPCDLVLADVVMPGMTADALAARLRELRPGIRMLFMSGYGRSGHVSDWPDAGVQVIGKPFSREGLLARVIRVLAADVGGDEPAGTAVRSNGA